MSKDIFDMLTDMTVARENEKVRLALIRSEQERQKKEKGLVQEKYKYNPANLIKVIQDQISGAYKIGGEIGVFWSKHTDVQQELCDRVKSGCQDITAQMVRHREELAAHKVKIDTYAARILSSPTVVEADGIAIEMKQQHDQFFGVWAVREKEIVQAYTKKAEELIQAGQVPPPADVPHHRAAVPPAASQQAETERLKKLLRDMEAQMQQKDEEVQKSREENQTLITELQKRDDIIEQQGQEIQNQREEIQRQGEEIQRQGEEIQRQGEEIQRQGEEIAELKQDNTTLRADKVELQERVVELEQQVVDLRESDAAKAAQIDDLTLRLQDEQHKYVELRAQYDTFLGEGAQHHEDGVA